MSVTTKLLNCSRGLSDRGNTWYSLGDENGTELAGTKALWGKGETFGFYLESFHLWKQSTQRFHCFLPAAITHNDLLSCHPRELPESRVYIHFQFLTLKCRNQNQSLSFSLCQTPVFFKWFKKKKKTKLSVKLHQMANAILPNSEMEVRDRKPYKLCLLSLCQTGAQSLSNCKIIQKLSDVLNYCKTNIDISIKTVKCTPGYAGKIKARAFLSWAPMM